MFKSLSIRWKLTLMALTTTAVALLLTIAAIAVYEYVVQRRMLRDEQHMLSELVGGNSTAAITFNRADDAASILANLGAVPHVRAACIYDADGNPLAKYVAPGESQADLPSRPPPEGSRVTANRMATSHPIQLDGKAIGTLYIQSDFRNLNDSLALFAWVSPFILLAAFGVGFVIIRQLQRVVSVPLVMLATTSRRISSEEDYSLRAPNLGTDELGQLADAFNHMLDGIRQRDQQIQSHLAEVRSARDELETRVQERTGDLQRANGELQAEMGRRHEAERKREQMQANLVEASRKAGMADVATGVLHNVGNVLNSINVSTQLAHDALKASRVGTLVKAVELLTQNADNLPAFLTGDARGKSLPGFLNKLAEALTQERVSLLTEMDGLVSNIAHIREIVAMQQSLSRAAGVQVPVTLGELIEDALKINHAGLHRHNVTLVRDFDPAFKLVLDRHKVLQILINLVSNAKYAVDGCAEDTRRIIIRAAPEPTGMLRIDIIDNGVGIEPQNMSRIFGFGFTTKKQGHGFGLHSSALAAKEIGGSLVAHSEGQGKGATFTLTLPVAVAAARPTNRETSNAA